MSPSSPVGRVRGRRTFSTLRRTGTRRRSGPIVITALVDDRQSEVRMAFAIPRTVGTAVRRNRLRRRLRAIAGDLDLAPGTYLVSAAPGASRLTFDELAGHVRKASSG